MVTQKKKSRLLQQLDKLDLKSIQIGSERSRELLSESNRDFSPDAYRVAGIANTAAKLGYAESDIAKSLCVEASTLRKLMKRYPNARVSVQGFLSARPSVKK